MYRPPPHLWPPQQRGIEQTIDRIDRNVDVCLYAPTGGGKTEVAVQLFHWALSRGWTGAFYVNRRLLIGQTAERFAEAGLPYGIRAAEYEDNYDFSAPFQICSADTERARVYERNIWPQCEARLVIVDEGHLQKTGTMNRILSDHRKRGAKVVLMTATPVGLSRWADELVISGSLAEYRACKALVPAVVRSIEQPDLRKVARNKVGEYILDGKRKSLYVQTIVGSVIERWKRHNPDGKPTLLYAPGVAESVWFTEQFRRAGVNWAHIDATDAVVDGQRAKLSRMLWVEIQERFRKGDIKGISNRFKAREGIDLPFVYHCILATPIGSLASYIQTCGRVLRWSEETPDKVLVTDHGGNYFTHGSPNHDRPWQDWWSLPEAAVSTMHITGIRNQTTPEPIRCPQCDGERTAGATCPHCGFCHPKSVRRVIQEDGAMVEHEGDLIPPKRIRLKSDTAEIWKGMILGNRRYRKNRTFRQVEAWFFHEHHYYPPRNIPFMPRREEDWCRKVWQVPLEQLTSDGNA